MLVNIVVALLALGLLVSWLLEGNSSTQDSNWPNEDNELAVSEPMEDDYYEYTGEPVEAAIFYEDGSYENVLWDSEFVADYLACNDRNVGRFTFNAAVDEATSTDIEALLLDRQTDRHMLAEAFVFADGAEAVYTDQDRQITEAIYVARLGTDWNVISAMSCSDHVEYRKQVMSTPSTTTAAPTTTIATTTTTTIPNGRPVPNVVELDVNEAILVLFDWDLEIDRRDQHSDQLPAGTIIGTEPITGTMVAPGTVVTMVVSSGPAVET